LTFFSTCESEAHFLLGFLNKSAHDVSLTIQRPIYGEEWWANEEHLWSSNTNIDIRHIPTPMIIFKNYIIQCNYTCLYCVRVRHLDVSDTWTYLIQWVFVLHRWTLLLDRMGLLMKALNIISTLKVIVGSMRKIFRSPIYKCM